MEQNYEGYYYKQENGLATSIVVDYLTKTIHLVKECPLEEITKYDEFSIVSERTANVLLDGFAKRYFPIIETNYKSTVFSESQKRKFYVFRKFNERVLSKEYQEIINEELRIFSKFNDKRMKYTLLKEKYDELISKCDCSKLADVLNLNDKESEAKRLLKIANALMDKEKTGLKEVDEKLKSDKNYQMAQHLSGELQRSFVEFVDALVEFEIHEDKERQLFSKQYKDKIQEYVSEGLFLYRFPTPDLPIDDERVTIDDIYNYFLDDDAAHLKDAIDAFITFGSFSEINKRESDDLIASYNLLVEKKYWASLRNLYALIDHHHKLCSDIFNGYLSEKKEFRHAHERADYISKLFKQLNVNYYETIWGEINKAIGEMNKGEGDRFVSRNAIVHGDYENPNINPSAKDVVNIFMLYISLRYNVDHLANIEEAIKDINIYGLGYAINNKK